jgi:hypothetical protein
VPLADLGQFDKNDQNFPVPPLGAAPTAVTLFSGLERPRFSRRETRAVDARHFLDVLVSLTKGENNAPQDRNT